MSMKQNAMKKPLKTGGLTGIKGAGGRRDICNVYLLAFCGAFCRVFSGNAYFLALRIAVQFGGLGN